MASICLIRSKRASTGYGLGSFAWLFGLLLCCAHSASHPADARGAELTIYVSPNGDDAANGSAPEPNMDGAGPLRTIGRAQSLVREVSARADSAQKTAVTVLLREGRYELDQPLTFGPEDSGAPNAPVTYRSYPGEIAHIDGGRRVYGWRRVDRNLWSVHYRDPLSPNGCPAQLFVGGERRSRPRLPVSGSFRIAQVAAKSTGVPQPNDRFYAHREDLPTFIDTNDDTEVVIFDAWTASRMRLKSYDPGTGLLKLSGMFVGHGLQHDMVAGLPYYIENFKGSPSAERTWQCDETTGEITYRSANGEDLATEEVVASHLSRLITLEGRADRLVHDIRFEGIYFEHTSWHLPPTGWGAMQAEVGLPAAIEISNAASIEFNRFALVRTGASGIRVRTNCSNIVISGGELRDLGGTGIAIGSEQRKPLQDTFWKEGETSSARTHSVTISDNLIASVGRIHWAAVGIWIGQADHVLIEHNEIRDLYYTGISVGWTWEYGPSLSHDNRIVGNIISNFGQGQLSDMGGIYTLGRQTNSSVEDNIVLQGRARTYGGHGLYADAGTAGFTFRNNLVVGVSHAGIHIHYGTDLLFESNYLFDYGEAAVRCTKPSKGTSVVFRNNMLWSEKAPPFFGVCKDRSYIFENNDVEMGAERLLSGVPKRAREAVDLIRLRAGRISEIRFTSGMRDGPINVP